MNQDLKKKRYSAGTRVKVDDLSGRPMFSGSLVRDFDGEADLPEVMGVADTPEILLDDGRTLHGCECWWIPMEEALEAAEPEIIRLRALLAEREAELREWKQDAIDAMARCHLVRQYCLEAGNLANAHDVLEILDREPHP